MGNLFKDLRFATRVLVKRPGFTIIVIFTLALGIGANSTIFGLVNATLLRPLPVEEPDALAVLYSKEARAERYSGISYPDYVDCRDGNSVFSGMIAYTPLPLSLSTAGKNERVWGEIVTGNYFSVLGVKPALGRLLAAEDERGDAGQPPAVISYGAWKGHFNSDPSVVGRTVTLNGRAFSVVGVAPEGFQGVYYIGFSPVVWIPMNVQPQVMPGGDLLHNRSVHWLRVMGRLRSGVTLAQAQAAMTQMGQRLAQEYPDVDKEMGLFLFREKDVRPEPEAAGALSLMATILMAVVGLVLLIACANVANLMLARAAGRRKEIATRLALGATRGRLIRQLLTESMLLSSLGGVAGYALSLLASRGISSLRLPIDIPFVLDLAPDRRLLGFTLAVSVLSGIIFGLAPALQASRPNIIPALKNEAGIVVEGRRRFRLYNLLVVLQLAVSVVVLTGAGLFLRSVRSAQQIHVGFETSNGMMMSVDPTLQGYDQAKGEAFYRQVVERVKATQGVQGVTLVSPLPLDYISYSEKVETDQGGTDAGNQQSIRRSIVGPDYFKTVGTSLVSGRDFNEHDRKETPGVVVVNETMARRYWPGQDAIGRRIRIAGTPARTLEVVGVARDGKYRSLGEYPQPYMYLPLSQNYTSEYMTIVVRASGDPKALLPAVRREVQSLDENMPVFDARTMTEFVDRSLIWSRLAAWLVGAFGLLALVMTAVGLYGVISYSVSQRTREIGIRMALGASAGDVLKQVLRECLWPLFFGLTVGLIAALAVGRIASSLLFGVGATDPLTFVAVSLILALVALVACYVPARKAMRVNPISALRSV